MKAIGPPERPASIPLPTQDLPRAKSHGKGLRLWFVRHAEVAARYHEMAYGSMNVELSEEGQQQTARMGEAFRHIPVARILSSDLDRARVMGEAISAATGVPVESHVGLREMNRGDWQGIPKVDFIEFWHKQAATYWRDPYRWHAPGGEGDELLFKRAYPLLADPIESGADGILVVTAHGQLIRVLLSRFLGLSVPESYDYYPDPAHGTCLVDGPDGWELVARNLSPEQVSQ